MGRRLNTAALSATALSAAAASVLLLVSPTLAGAAPAAVTSTSAPVTYTVVAAPGVTGAQAVAAVVAAGGTVLSRNDKIGTYEVSTSRADFAHQVARSHTLIGAVSRRAIGRAPGQQFGSGGAPAKVDAVEQATGKPGPRRASAKSAAASFGTGQNSRLDPLDDRLWGLKMVRSELARHKEPGRRGVTVGIIDTGLDASNPDLAPNFDADLSRNFAPDIEALDGPCEVRGCVDPVGTDDGGHGTHVAGSVGAAANGFGVSGVAPNVTLVELKAGQDSGYFFLDSVVNSLTYAGDAGIDVVNMSFYVDPWAFNCPNNPADSPDEQAEQVATIEAMTRALDYAHDKGVTMFGALGNAHTDLAKPGTDTASPNVPANTAHPRVIDNASCVDLPVEGPHVIGVSSIGPSGRKADYSNYGTEQISISAPGGYTNDYFGTPWFKTVENTILSTYPKSVLQAKKYVDANGDVAPDKAGSVFKQCDATGQCGYYTYLQGTSMASPYAAGVAALIVSKYGTRAADGGLTMSPDAVEKQLLGTAATRPCPEPRTVSYKNEGRDATWDATCEGTQKFNGFYGYGIVDAYAAVTKPLKP